MKQDEIVLTGGYPAYEALHEFVVLFGRSAGYSPEFMEDIQLALKEAFVNAVKHGNREQRERSVTCSLTASASGLQASIRDCGAGFALSELSDPTEGANRTKTSGRGLYIIQSIAEIVALVRDGEGSTLILSFQDSAHPHLPA